MAKVEFEDSDPLIGGMCICRPSPLVLEPNNPVGLRLMSDLHIGAAHVDYKLINREIKEAVDRNDRVLINGDLLDLILPKDAKRYDATSVHPRIAKHHSPINAAVDWAVELFAPAAHLIDMIGVGNHETAVQKWHSVDPTLLIIIRLEQIAHQRNPEHVIHYGGYTGFVDYRIKYPQTSGGRWVLYYHHGSGGAAPVTKGIIDFSRRDVFIDSDMVWMGHRHNRLVVTIEKLRCPLKGDNPDVRSVHHVMTGAYFDTYRGQTQASIREFGRRSNYAADMGMAPGGKGGARIELCMDSSSMFERPSVRIIQ